ncbi:hypothetical protein K402DRAFT_227938 [Aulographum hederae CBS 113979]|uniref:Uncharacterized protein n=1 Tax=Aulographum hederae CBS 113979 TaxID=1176131 RepID=A0A6G1HAZ4_9PEZI|nr:hypothetical protein K402DRAFT_227938 [Aulographum hederae CBS 113979]
MVQRKASLTTFFSRSGSPAGGRFAASGHKSKMEPLLTLCALFRVWSALLGSSVGACPQDDMAEQGLPTILKLLERERRGRSDFA